MRQPKGTEKRLKRIRNGVLLQVGAEGLDPIATLLGSSVPDGSLRMLYVAFDRRKLAITSYSDFPDGALFLVENDLEGSCLAKLY